MSAARRSWGSWTLDNGGTAIDTRAGGYTYYIRLVNLDQRECEDWLCHIAEKWWGAGIVDDLRAAFIELGYMQDIDHEPRRRNR